MGKMQVLKVLCLKQLYHFKYNTILIFIAFYTGIKAQPLPIENISDFHCNNFIYIKGETNINYFTLKNFYRENFRDHIKMIKGQSHQSKKNYIIKVPVKDFETTNPILYKDFLKLIKAKEYPEVIINIPSFNPSLFVKEGVYNINEINITIAGVTRTFNIPCIIHHCDKEYFYFNGSQKILLTDFNLDPPEKSFGLIKVKNEIIINFGLVLHNI